MDSRRGPGMATRSTLRAPVGERDPCCVTQCAQVECVVLDKPRNARFRNQASVTKQDVGKHLICDLPSSLPYHDR